MHLCIFAIISYHSILQAVRAKYASSKFMKISACAELKGQVVKELASENELWMFQRDFNRKAVMCVLSVWLKWNCRGPADGLWVIHLEVDVAACFVVIPSLWEFSYIIFHIISGKILFTNILIAWSFFINW